MELARPYNLLMPFRGHRLVVQVHGALEGELPAVVELGAPPKPLPTTRLFTTRIDKRSKRTYTDVTTAQARAMLAPMLESGMLVGKAVEFRSRGRGATRRDSIHIAPLQAP